MGVWEQCKFRGYWNPYKDGSCRRKFESSVNSEGIETKVFDDTIFFEFESSVNSEGIETINHITWNPCKFESSVNSEGIETCSM